MLPNFLIIGAMKAGTTSLYSYLKTHPQVYMPVNKEPNFFSNEAEWKRGLGWYESLFKGNGDMKAVNVITPDSIISLATSDMRRIFSVRSSMENPKSPHKP